MRRTSKLPHTLPTSELLRIKQPGFCYDCSRALTADVDEMFSLNYLPPFQCLRYATASTPWAIIILGEHAFSK